MWPSSGTHGPGLLTRHRPGHVGSACLPECQPTRPAAVVSNQQEWRTARGVYGHSTLLWGTQCQGLYPKDHQSAVL